MTIFGNKSTWVLNNTCTLHYKSIVKNEIKKYFVIVKEIITNDGTEDRVHGLNEAVGTEMFNSTGLYMGDWVAVRSGSNPANQWELYNFMNDPGQNHNIAPENPILLQKMVSAYENYSKTVGIVISRGDLFAKQVAHLTPSFNDTQTVQMGYILPEQLAIAKELVQNGTFAVES